MSPNETDNFGGLPDELKIGIILELPLHDIHALTMASPAMLRYFRKHEASIVQPHLDYIMDHYGSRNAIPLVIIATRFRRLRDKLEGMPASEVEERVAPMVESIKARPGAKHQFKFTSYAQDPSLSVLAAATSLVLELTDAFRDWQLLAMKLIPCEEGVLCQERNVPIGKIPAVEKWKFIESFLRYDCYCNFTYHPDLFLFQDQRTIRVRQSIRRPFYGKDFSRLEITPGVCHRVFGFRPFELFVHQFEKVVEDVRSYLRQSQGSSNLRITDNPSQLDDEQREDITEFLKMDRAGRDYFCDRLAIQGNRLKVLLESLDEEARAEYLVKEFNQIISIIRTDKATYRSDSKSFAGIRMHWF